MKFQIDDHPQNTVCWVRDKAHPHYKMWGKALYQESDTTDSPNPHFVLYFWGEPKHTFVFGKHDSHCRGCLNIKRGYVPGSPMACGGIFPEITFVRPDDKEIKVGEYA